MSGQVIISARDIENRFGVQVVHRHLSLDIMAGEIIGIVGGSGSGKSVLMRTMTGLNIPAHGVVKIMGNDIGDVQAADFASMFGVLFQHGALFSSMSVLENIMLPLKEHTGFSRRERERIACLKLVMTGLRPDDGKKRPSALSGGMIKRAALARALALDPPILFLDEPTAGLDPIAAAQFDELIVNLNRNLRVTVVIITHDLDTLFTVCHRIAVLVDKKVVVGTLPELLRNQHPWIQEYFHGPRARAAIN